VANVSIRADDEVFRRLSPESVDRTTHTVRRNAFYTRGQPDPEVSVHLRRLASTPEEVLNRAGRRHFGVGLLAVAEIRALGFTLEPRPLPDDESHAVILGVKSRSDCDRLAEITSILKVPD
jgi:hypothetical protein